MTTTTKQNSRLGLSWLETRIFDALSPDYSSTIAEICRSIETIEPDYRTTESSIIRTVNDLARRGLVSGEKTTTGWRWRRAADPQAQQAEEEQRQRTASEPAQPANLSMRDRKVLRTIGREGPCSRGCIADALDVHTLTLGPSLKTLERLGLIERNGYDHWRTPAAAT